MFFVFFQCIINAIVAKLGMLIGTITLYYSYMLLTACLALIHELEVCMPVLILVLQFSQYQDCCLYVHVCIPVLILVLQFSWYQDCCLYVCIPVLILVLQFSWYQDCCLYVCIPVLILILQFPGIDQDCHVCMYVQIPVLILILQFPGIRIVRYLWNHGIYLQLYHLVMLVRWQLVIVLQPSLTIPHR